LAFGRFAMPNHISALTIGAVQDLHDHGAPHSR
jgi:hypothetical protein